MRPGPALGVLAGALAVAIVVTTPWHPLGAGVPVPRPDPALDFTSAQLARAQAFHAQVQPWRAASTVLGVGVPVLLGVTALGARLVDGLGRRLGTGWWWPVLAGSVTLTALTRLVTVPLDAQVERVARRFGLSTQSWAAWLADAGKEWALATGILLVVATIFYAVSRASPRHWWAWLSGVAAAGVVLGSFVYPVVVEPVFTSFRPLGPGPLRTELLAMADRDGLPVRGVLVADASRRTTAFNAYVSGFGASRRIVIYDTLLEQGASAQVRLVVAHELGHAARHDVLTETLLGAGGAAAMVPLLALALQWTPLTRRAGLHPADRAGLHPADRAGLHPADRAGLHPADRAVPGAGPPAADPRSLPLLLATAVLVACAVTPLTNLISRHVEARADVHALDLTGDPGTFVAMQRTLAVRNISDLDPPWWRYLWTATHPTGPERIALARGWAARYDVPDPHPLARPDGAVAGPTAASRRPAVGRVRVARRRGGALRARRRR